MQRRTGMLLLRKKKLRLEYEQQYQTTVCSSAMNSYSMQYLVLSIERSLSVFLQGVELELRKLEVAVQAIHQNLIYLKERQVSVPPFCVNIFCSYMPNLLLNICTGRLFFPGNISYMDFNFKPAIQQRVCFSFV